LPFFLKDEQFSVNARAQFLGLLGNYQRDFIALVEQNNHIKKVVKEMELVAVNVSQLVNKKVIEHNKKMIDRAGQINELSAKRAILMFWMVIIGIVLGIVFAFNFTSRIVRLLRKMAIILEKLTYTENIEKMHYQENGRDEINSMVGSLNILCDHRKSFIDWWKNSMAETESCEQLEKIIALLSENGQGSELEFKQIKFELTEILAEKKKLLCKEYHEIKEYNQDIINQSALIGHASIPREDMDKAASSINYNANLIQKKLDMLSYNTP